MLNQALETMATIRQIDAPSTAIANRLRCGFKRPCGVVVLWRCGTMTLAWLALLCLVSSPSRAQIPDVLCKEGSGSFEAAFHTGVKVRGGAAKKGGLARRLCEAAMGWGLQNGGVGNDAFLVDADAF